ncbi:MAG: ISL3 family transposase, partial [Anaerolineales bacterium]|nr:ISL3 family transposase [Anaerolineales bacterium]
MVIILDAGKWFCGNPACEQQIFTERLPDVVAPSARRTQRLARTQADVGLALGGRAGSRLSSQLQIVTSRDTLLRLVRAQPLEERATPRVLGIDDWAKRKGQTYGTILVDLESHEVIDILPERSAESIEQWLKAHPGVEIITRDRAGDYAAGASAGAPAAMQVADRWHLLKNLGEVLVDVLKPHSKELRAIPLTVEETSGDESLVDIRMESDQEAPALPNTARTQQSLEKRAERLARYERVRELSKQGWAQKAIAAEVGIARKTVGRWLATGTFPERQSSRR